MKEEGRAFFVYPAKRRTDFERALEESGLRLSVLRLVCPDRDGEANLFLASCDFSAEKERSLPPLILFERKGKYSEEAEEIFSGRIHAEVM